MTQTTNNSTWHKAIITKIKTETPTVKTFSFAMPKEVNHVAGQHYEIRLTAPDGYQAARLYSAASYKIGSANNLDLTIALLPDGEVSPYMFEQVLRGDELEIRGPLGKFFVWSENIQSPVLLLAGGSGVVPMRCMLQSHQYNHSKAKMKLIYSARNINEIIYRDELMNDNRALITLTNEHAKWPGNRGRVDSDTIKSAINSLGNNPICYVCGTNSFVEAMTNLLIEQNIPANNIKTERFGG